METSFATKLLTGFSKETPPHPPSLLPSPHRSSLPISPLPPAPPHPDPPGCPLPPFSPYTATVPWHTGIRAVFSHVFPKYGNYCGPNWSSGRSRGSLHWDTRPIDLLDHCCFCHDVGYDSHDQARLHKADIAFLECLTKMPPLEKASPRGNAIVAEFYRNACIAGLRAFLLPYRKFLLQRTEVMKNEVVNLKQ